MGVPIHDKQAMAFTDNDSSYKLFTDKSYK